jgi:hypothetical protein
MEGLTNEEEDIIFETKLKLFSIGIITLLEKTILSLSVRVSKIKSTEKSNLEQKTSNQTVAKLVPSIVKSENFCVKLEVSLENKVYPKTYYHHSQDDIQVDKTPMKIQVQNL